jgi:hypothetical protein
MVHRGGYIKHGLPTELPKGSKILSENEYYGFSSKDFKSGGMGDRFLRMRYENAGGTYTNQPLEQPSSIGEYIRYKASLPGQYVMAKGEAGLMRAGEARIGLGDMLTPSTAKDIGGRVSTRASLWPESIISERAYGEQRSPISTLLTKGTKPTSPDIGGRASYYVEGALGEVAYGKKGTPSLEQLPGRLKISGKSFLQELTAKQTPEQLLGKATGAGAGGAPAIRKGYGGTGQAATQASAPEKLFGGKIGRPSETMKPWDLTQTKQSATAIQMYRTESLPGMEQMTAPRGRTAPSMAVGLFQVQVPRATVRPQQQQQFIKGILPEFAVAPASRQVFATETILAQEQTRKKITPVMMSYDVLVGQRQRTVQQLAVGLEFGTTFRQSQESLRRQKYITGIDTGVRLRQDTSILTRTSTLVDQGTLTRQRTDLITTPRQWTIPGITKITVPGLPFWPSGGSAGGGGGRKGKSPFREQIPIRSQLFSAAGSVLGKGTKKKYVEVGKEYTSVVSGRKTTVRHKHKTGR